MSLSLLVGESIALPLRLFGAVIGSYRSTIERTVHLPRECMMLVLVVELRRDKAIFYIFAHRVL